MNSRKLGLNLFGALLLGNAGPAAVAALHWERTRVEQILPVGVDLAELQFVFLNPEDHPITIVHLEPSCGCTTANIGKYTFAPGERGIVTALFDGKGLSGLQEKTIRVELDDQSKPVTLTLQMNIPPWLEISRRVLHWNVGEENTPKEAIITLNVAARPKIAAVGAEGPAIKMKLEPYEGFRCYRLVVEPSSTAKPAQAIATITLDVPGSAPRNYLITAQVR